MIQLNTIIKTPTTETWLQESIHCRVHSVFGGVCNLVNESGKVLSMVAQREDLGPFAIQVEPYGRSRYSRLDFREYVNLSTAVELDNDHLRIGSLRVTLSSGRMWNPKLCFDWSIGEKTERALDYLEQTVKARAPEDSLVSPIFLNRYRAAHHEQALLIWRQMKESIRLRSQEKWQSACQQMVGLGPGLTPSGDDFLIGLIFGLNRILDEELSGDLISQIVMAASGRTNILSLTWIEAAGDLQAAFLWHRLSEAVSQSSEDDLLEVVQLFLGLGHTSGADALTGFLACR